MTSSLTIRTARKVDLPTVCSLLHTAKLPTDGVEHHIENYLIAESQGTVAGTIGLESYPPVALVRSAAVLPEFRNKGIGTMLFNTMLTVAEQQEITELFLFTNTAETYFKHKGFMPVEREQVNGAITASEEFRIHCCHSAVLMKRRI